MNRAFVEWSKKNPWYEARGQDLKSLLAKWFDIYLSMKNPEAVGTPQAFRDLDALLKARKNPWDLLNEIKDAGLDLKDL